MKLWQDKCDKLEKEKNDLLSKMESYVDLDTLHKVKQEKHRLQKGVALFLNAVDARNTMCNLSLSSGCTAVREGRSSVGFGEEDARAGW